MSSQTFTKGSLIGGVSGALDSIDGDLVNNGDRAIITTSSLVYFYVLSASSGLSESSPDIISPDTNAGTKRWLLSNILTEKIFLNEVGARDELLLHANSEDTFIKLFVSGSDNVAQIQSDHIAFSSADGFSLALHGTVSGDDMRFAPATVALNKKIDLGVAGYHFRTLFADSIDLDAGQITMVADELTFTDSLAGPKTLSELITGTTYSDSGSTESNCLWEHYDATFGDDASGGGTSISVDSSDLTDQPLQWMEREYTNDSATVELIPMLYYGQTKVTGSGKAFTNNIMTVIENAGTGDNDAVGIAGRAIKTGLGIGDSCGIWGSAYNKAAAQYGGIMGLEASIYNNVSGTIAKDSLGFNAALTAYENKWTVGLHVQSDSTGSNALAGIGVDASSDHYGFWNGILIDSTTFRDNGSASDGASGTVGINLSACRASHGYPEIGLKFNEATYHIKGVERLDFYSVDDFTIVGRAGQAWMSLYDTSGTDVGLLQADEVAFVTNDGNAISIAGDYNNSIPANSTARIGPSYDYLSGYVDLGASTRKWRTLFATDMNLTGLPTSASGLSSGDIWANSNVLTVVP